MHIRYNIQNITQVCMNQCIGEHASLCGHYILHIGIYTLCKCNTQYVALAAVTLDTLDHEVSSRTLTSQHSWLHCVTVR